MERGSSRCTWTWTELFLSVRQVFPPPFAGWHLLPLFCSFPLSQNIILVGWGLSCVTTGRFGLVGRAGHRSFAHSQLYPELCCTELAAAAQLELTGFCSEGRIWDSGDQLVELLDQSLCSDQQLSCPSNILPPVSLLMHLPGTLDWP